MSEWISVKDRLPDENCLVLFYCKNGAIFSGCMQYNGLINKPISWATYGPLGTGRNVATNKVTHWMTLPEPPAKGE